MHFLHECSPVFHFEWVFRFFEFIYFFQLSYEHKNIRHKMDDITLFISSIVFEWVDIFGCSRLPVCFIVHCSAENSAACEIHNDNH